MFSKQVLSLSFVLLLGAVTPSKAETSHQAPMFDAIHAGDLDRAEALIAEAAALDVHARYQRARDLFKTFTAADPRIFDFARKWAEERPESAAGHIANATMLRSMAYRVRGGEPSRFTYPDAMSLYSSFMDQAAVETWRAYDIAPDNVVAVDLVMEMRGPDRMKVLAGIMETAPNWVTVVNAAASYAPQWGGSYEQMAQVCDVYAPVSGAEPPITAAFCLVAAAYEANLPWSYLDRVDPLLIASDDARLDFARRERVMRTFDFTDKNVAVFQAYLSDPATTDVKAARYYDGYARAHGLPAFEVDVTNRAIADARRRIVDEPYSPDLLKTLATPSTSRVPIENPASWDEMVELMRKRLTYSPYNGEFWEDYARALLYAQMAPAGDWDAAFGNAIVYSNYKPERIETYMSNKGGLLSEFLYIRSQGRVSTRFPEGYATIGADVTCPLVTLLRFHDAVCGGQGGGGICRTEASVIDEYRTMTNIPIADGACPRERAAPLEELAFVARPLPTN